MNEAEIKKVVIDELENLGVIIDDSENDVDLLSTPCAIFGNGTKHFTCSLSRAFHLRYFYRWQQPIFPKC